MSLDITPFERALHELEDFLALCTEAGRTAPQDARHARAFQAAAIQGFEFTYELAHRMLRRYLQATLPSSAEIAALSFPDLVRTGYGKGVVGAEWKVWARFRDMRNITSHTYDPARAAEVLAAIPAFVQEARGMLATMQAAPAP